MSLKKKISVKLNGLVRRSYWYNEVAFPDCKKFWTHKIFNLDVVNLGSTSGLNAFNYEGVPLKAANWALGHNPILADQEMLNNYFSFLNPKGSTVILSLCPFTGLSGSYDYFEDRYYTLLRMSSIPHCSYRRKTEVMNRKSSPLRFYPLFNILNDVKRIFIGKVQPKFSEQQAKSDAKRWMANWMKEFSITDFSYPLSMVNRDGIEDAAKVLNEIVAFCKERNISPIMLIPPVYHTLGEFFTPEIRKKIIDSLIERVKDKTVWYHNYMDDPEFTNNISLFQNSYLMNEKGAKLFTRRVLNDLGLVKDM